MNKKQLLAGEYIKYEKLSDEELIDLIHDGDAFCQDFLIGKYKNLVRIKARAYFLIGSDRDDIIQEGMIGLFKAIRDFEKGRLSSFYTFADLCITRQIFTAIKTATRKKHLPLNGYISLNRSVNDDDASPSFSDITIFLGKESNPESIIIEREDRRYIERRMSESLSPFETKVLNLYLLGKSYAETAETSGRTVKSVDNAIQRIKRKIEKYVLEKKLDS